MTNAEFRFWDKDKKVMVYYEPHMSFDKMLVTLGGVARYCDGSGKTPKGTLMQYTEVKDKNGRKVFEGDIVRVTYHSIPEELHVGTVAYDADSISFVIKSVTVDGRIDFIGRMVWFGSTVKETTEVIGNIYENPELLENNHEDD